MSGQGKREFVKIGVGRSRGLWYSGVSLLRRLPCDDGGTGRRGRKLIEWGVNKNNYRWCYLYISCAGILDDHNLKDEIISTLCSN